MNSRIFFKGDFILKKYRLLRKPQELLTLVFLGVLISLVFTPVITTVKETVDWDKVSIKYVQKRLLEQEEKRKELREKQSETINKKQTKDK